MKRRIAIMLRRIANWVDPQPTVWWGGEPTESRTGLSVDQLTDGLLAGRWSKGKE